MNSDLYSVSNEQHQSKIRFLLLVIFFIFSFIPIVPNSLNGLSINYSFMLLPAYIILKKNLVIVKPPDTIMWGFAIFTFIFILAILFQASQYELFVRRFASFLIFMSIFSFSIIHIEERLMLGFKKGVIIISAIFSLISILGFFEMKSAGSIHFGLKDVIGSQRFGFIYLIAFWILLDDLKQGTNNRVINSILIMIISSGLFLTFSRSAMVALVLPLLLFITINFKFSWFFRIQKLKQLTLLTIFLFILFWVVFQNFSITFEYYIERLWNPLMDKSIFEEAKLPGSSEGIRLFRLKEVINYVLLNPFTGSGYLGVWAISETGSGSTHGQLNDVLLRVGLFGFIFYVYLGICLLTFLWRIDKSLFWGLLSVVIYGFFHETFKEPHGAFILAFLFGVYSQHLRKKKIAYLNKKSKYLNS